MPRPTPIARAVFEACVDSLHPGPLKDRLRLVSGEIEAAEARYVALAPLERLFTIEPMDELGHDVSSGDMQRLYKNTFVRSVATRPIYDQLKRSPANDTCPLCGQRTVSTLDHYLAQSRHPGLVVSPANLVPACAECNKAKLDAQPASAEEQTFHPYFDNFDDGVWIAAAVAETIPASVRFWVAPPGHWAPAKIERAHRHFRSFKLATLYASHAAAELTNIRHLLGRIAERGSAQDVRAHLQDMSASAAHAHANSWQAAAYRAFAASDWFCQGGFALT